MAGSLIYFDQEIHVYGLMCVTTNYNNFLYKLGALVNMKFMELPSTFYFYKERPFLRKFDDSQSH